MMRRNERCGTRWICATLALAAMLLLLAACGGGGAEPQVAEDAAAGASVAAVTAAPAGGGRVVPTMPAARFAAPTTMIDATKVAQSASTPAPEAADVAFGEDAYARLCADCHGEGLAGEAGKAEPIDAYGLDVTALTDLLRTGGGYGPEHLFGLNKVSPAGIASLQAYLDTLDGSE